jgi:protein-S-isoprenylcysteine O-methyltransferase Ste14
MSESQISQAEVRRKALTLYFASWFGLMILFFLPAGTLAYWEAWLYLVMMFGAIALVATYLFRNDPGLLARRMKTREKEAQQALITKLSLLPFLLAFLLPGFDKRFGWSNVPWWVVLVGDILVMLGYGIIFQVFRANRYTARVVEVEEGQTVIQSGPYAVVRHPMYVGSLILFIFSPLALGSYWAMLPALLTIAFIVARLLNEEKVLARDLKGYPEYMQKVRYRLLPGIW